MLPIEPVIQLVERATVELHAHLFMKEGMTWSFHGHFDGPLRAQDWRDRLSSQANPESVEQSEIGVLVATLYAHPLFTLNMRDSIRRQIKQAEKFVTENPQWVIARSATEAQKATQEGRRAMILALEGASGILETEEDLQEFIDQKGIRIVTLLHLTDDQYGGVAFLKGFKSLSNPWAWVKRVFGKKESNGLTQEGRILTEKLMARGVWVDLSHASDASAAELIELYRAKSLPLLYTHTSLRKYLDAERGLSETQLEAVARSGGVIGLMPSEDMLSGTPGECEDGVHALARQFTEISKTVDASQLVMGSDYNGGIPHLRPPKDRCKTKSGLDLQGLWNIGQVPELWTALENLGAPVPKPRKKMMDRFLESWNQIKPQT